ncbi:DinB family protein [Lysobacter sp. HA18]
MSLATLGSLFSFKAWADAESLAALAALPPMHAEQLHASLRTLNHVHVVDRLFRARLSGEMPPFDATNTTSTPWLDELRRDIEATDTWFVAYVSQLSDEDAAAVLAFEFTDGDTGRMTREEILLHLITHGGYHRGNVGQILKSIGVAPPRDVYTGFLHASEPERRTHAG